MAEEIVIAADQLNRLTVSDLRRYRHLFFALAKRDLLVRYRQAFFGAGWALIRPVFLAVSLSVALHGSGAIRGEEHPVLSVFLALILWQLFASGVSDATNSLVSHRTLISKIYIPRLFIPTAPIVVNLVDLCVGGLAFAVLFAATGLTLGPAFFLIFPLGALFVLLTLATGWFFAAMNVRFRDFRQLTPFFLQVLFFLSPIAYSLHVQSKTIGIILLLNPLTGIFEGFKYALLGAWHPLLPLAIAVSVIETALLFVFSLGVFNRLEMHFSDFV